MKTPVLFLIFNRPQYTAKALAAIRRAKPKKLYIAADGPRSSKEGEKELCEQTRELVLNSIDWECEVKTLFQEKNLGCGLGVSTGISWFFEHEEQGIIIEDDVVTNLSFFKYCAELLEKYKDVQNIWTISGYRRGISASNESYYFSKSFFCWGWATWRDRWQYFSLDIKNLKEEILDFYTKNKLIKNYYAEILWRMHSTNPKIHIDSWAYPYHLIGISHKALHIYPQKNMTTNIGEFGSHFKGKNAFLYNKTYKLNISNHPKKIIIDSKIQNEFDIMRKIQKYPKIPIVKNRKIYIWGTGAFALKVLFLARKHKITAFLDKQQKEECYGYKVMYPEKVLNNKIKDFFIFIASTKYAKEISKLCRESGLKKGKDFWSPE